MRFMLLCIVGVVHWFACEWAGAAPLGPPGLRAAYRLESDPAQRPDFEKENRLSVVSAEIRLGPTVETADQGTFQWYGLSLTRLNEQHYEMWILVDRWPTADADPTVLRYVWREPEWPDAVSYAHESTGEPVLPRLPLWTYGWPQDPETGGGERRAPVAGAPERILLHGWLFARVSSMQGDWPMPPDEWTTIPLHPDLLIGWISMDSDEAGRPFYRLPDGNYSYTRKSPEDLLAHARAGCNFFVSHPKTAELPDWLIRSPLFHSNLVRRFQDWPADLYRSNYWGHCNHIDEPGVANWGFRPSGKPGRALPEIQAVESLQRTVEAQSRKRGRTSIHDNILGRNFASGALTLDEKDFPSWEYEWATAWYQLAVKDGVGGLVDEDTTVNDLVESYNMAFDTEIPPTVENAVALRVAVLRGAARNFEKKWGVAFYHPNEVKLKSATIPLVYDKGATYIWFWTGWVGITDNSGLPFSYQRYYASLARQAYHRNPNRDMTALLRAARVAVVLPNGYTFAPHAMHRSPWLHLERENEHGVRYRRVLSNAAMEIERLLRLGVDFDIAIDEPRFHARGYDELVYARSDGTVAIVRPGHPDEILDAPRPFERPDLGPGPSLSLSVEEEDGKPGRIRLRANAKIGTGEWAAEIEEARVWWEVYDPEGKVSPEIFPEFGPEKSLRLGRDVEYRIHHPVPEIHRRQGAVPDLVPGSYLVRAAVADIFGRPAVAYCIVEIEAPAGE